MNNENQVSQINKILNELVKTLKHLSTKQKSILNEAYASVNNANIKNANLSKDDEEFYKGLVSDIAKDSDDEINDVHVLLDSNEVAIKLYQQNIETYNELLKYALSIYDLYKDINIPYLEDAKVNSIANKEQITSEDFTYLYGYSERWQIARRRRVNNPLEPISKAKHKVLYNHNEVKIWLENEVLQGRLKQPSKP